MDVDSEFARIWDWPITERVLLRDPRSLGGVMTEKKSAAELDMSSLDLILSRVESRMDAALHRDEDRLRLDHSSSSVDLDLPELLTALNAEPSLNVHVGRDGAAPRHQEGGRVHFASQDRGRPHSRSGEPWGRRASSA